MSTRDKKRICIVEAKQEQIGKGMAQDLLGCEVVADLDQVDVVYGIVTNYTQWVFLQNSVERIIQDEFSIETDNGVPSKHSLVKITGKIYAMLS